MAETAWWRRKGFACRLVFWIPHFYHPARNQTHQSSHREDRKGTAAKIAKESLFFSASLAIPPKRLQSGMIPVSNIRSLSNHLPYSNCHRSARS
jgi:hypothetical protein